MCVRENAAPVERIERTVDYLTADRDKLYKIDALDRGPVSCVPAHFGD